MDFSNWTNEDFVKTYEEAIEKMDGREMLKKVGDIPTLTSFLPSGFMEVWKKAPTPLHDEEKEKLRREKEHNFWLGVSEKNDLDYQAYKGDR